MGMLYTYMYQIAKENISLKLQKTVKDKTLTGFRW